MNTIYLPFGIEGDLSFADFISFCERFECKAVPVIRKDSWMISSDDVMNFYWLGANMAFDHETGISISVLSELKKKKS